MITCETGRLLLQLLCLRLAHCIFLGCIWNTRLLKEKSEKQALQSGERVVQFVLWEDTRITRIDITDVHRIWFFQSCSSRCAYRWKCQRGQRITSWSIETATGGDNFWQPVWGHHRTPKFGKCICSNSLCRLATTNGECGECNTAELAARAADTMRGDDLGCIRWSLRRFCARRKEASSPLYSGLASSCRMQWCAGRMPIASITRLLDSSRADKVVQKRSQLSGVSRSMYAVVTYNLKLVKSTTKEKTTIEKYASVLKWQYTCLE